MGTEKVLKRSDSHGPQSLFEAHPRVAIAFSGGVDSTYLVTAAAQYAQSVHAYTIDSAFVPALSWKGPKR
ncbi:asparagine synthase-related protein [Acidaminococcus intestini]|nr:asparagine synthase-related protein [Acidaminococcus intestini]